MKKELMTNFSYTSNGNRDINFKEVLFLENEYSDFMNPTKTDITNCVTIYIDKNIKINRSKLKDTGYKIVREPAKADIILFNIDDYIDYKNLYKVSMGDYKNLHHFGSLNPKLTIDSQTSETLTHLIQEGKDLYTESWYASWIILPNSKEFDESKGSHTILEKDINHIKTMYFYKDKIISADLLYKNRTEEIVIDKELYNNLDSLFRSKDRENQVVALQALTNCNYIKSAPYILKLIFDHERRIFELREKNHINFKSLLIFFNINRLYNSISSIDNCVKKLESKKLMSLENLQILINLYSVDSFGIDSKYLTVSKLSLTNEAITSILEGETQLNSSAIDEEYLKNLSINFDDGLISVN